MQMSQVVDGERFELSFRFRISTLFDECADPLAFSRPTVGAEKDASILLTMT